VRNVVGLSLQRVSDTMFPPGTRVELPGRGSGYVYHSPAPPGAPTLVLLHGLWATGSLNWFPAFAPLAGRFGVAAADLRGHGRGIPVTGHFRVADCADDVAALVDALGTGPVILVGYSLGGVVAQMTWRRHPDRVAGLVLCATSRNFGGSRQEQLFYRGLLGAIVAGKFVQRSREPGDAPRPAVDTSTSVIVTTRDHFISPVRQRKLAAAIPGATVYDVESDHGACVLGADRFVPALVDACSSVAARVGTRAA
jgi:3-oxoadipate enol-lactonase